MPMFNEQQNNNNGFSNNLFAFNIIDIISLLIGLQNIELNISAKDLDLQTQTILDDLHIYLEKQEQHLELQDKYLTTQDKRIARLEHLLTKNVGITDKE